MGRFRRPTIGSTLRSAALAAFAALFAGAGPGDGTARAAPQSPVFSSPLAISHTHLPFVAGTVKVYGGVEDGGVAAMVVESHTPATRSFDWDGGTVVCRVIERIEFLRGVRNSTERSYVAQSDDGAVWSFGETDDKDVVDDSDEDESGGWIVGARVAGDPADTVEVSGPALLIPAAPRAGDVWTIEDAPPEHASEARAVVTSETVRSPSGRYDGCLRVRETDLADGTSELRWYAPGVGLVRERAPGERMTLRASTLRPKR